MESIRRFFRSNLLPFSIITTFIAGFALIMVYCWSKAGFTVKDIALTDWIGYAAACATVGSLIYVFVDKISSEQENRHIKWQSEIPFVTLASPCDPTQASCDINILFAIDGDFGRGVKYFTLCNLGKLNAYNVTVQFFYNQQPDTPPFYEHFIDYISPLQVFSVNPVYFETGKDEFGNPNYRSETYQQFSYQFIEAIYSRYRVDPSDKKISTDEFDLCGCTNQCKVTDDKSQTGEKEFFAKLTYHSSFSQYTRYQIISEYKVQIICTQEEDPTSPGQSAHRNRITIKGIVLLKYHYDFKK